MPNDPIADAKKFLDDSRAKFQPLSPTAPPVAQKAAASPAPGIGKELAVKKQMVDKAKEALNAPKMHDGGEVKKDGLHDLQKGEVVIPKDKVMKKSAGLMDGLAEAAEEKAEPKDDKKEEKSEKKDSKKKHSGKPHFKHTHVEHHDDGSHTVRHTGQPSEDGKPGEEMSYAAPDMAALNQGMSQNVGGEPAPGAAAEAAPAAAGPAAA